MTKENSVSAGKKKSKFLPFLIAGALAIGGIGFYIGRNPQTGKINLEKTVTSISSVGLGKENFSEVRKERKGVFEKENFSEYVKKEGREVFVDYEKITEQEPQIHEYGGWMAWGAEGASLAEIEYVVNGFNSEGIAVLMPSENDVKFREALVPYNGEKEAFIVLKDNKEEKKATCYIFVDNEYNMVGDAMVACGDFKDTFEPYAFMQGRMVEPCIEEPNFKKVSFNALKEGVYATKVEWDYTASPALILKNSEGQIIVKRK